MCTTCLVLEPRYRCRNLQHVLKSASQSSGAALKHDTDTAAVHSQNLSHNAHQGQSLELADSLLLSRLLFFPCSKRMRCLQSLQMESSSSIVTASLKVIFVQ